ncbi:MAG: hypothetical protein RL616_752 [Verrucomicrobiota bacterium]
MNPVKTFLAITVALALFAQVASAEKFSTAPGTLAYHLATNAAARATGPMDRLPFRAPNSLGNDRLTGAVWSQTFWLRGVQGLSATPIGFTNVAGGQGLPTMISPRHYLGATHMHPESYLIAFLDTNNVIHWRRTLQRVDVGNDTSVGILTEDLPPAVGFLPVLPRNFTNYLPATATNYVQGIGMNQDFYLFGEPMNFGNGGFVNWNSHQSVANGLGTNWNVTIRAGDSSNPAMFLIGNQLVLVSHNFFAGGGPNYAAQFSVINEKMHLLSTNNHVSSDYQLTEFPLTNWPKVR